MNPLIKEGITALEALELCERAAAGCFTAWPHAMRHRMRSGTSLGWRVNRVGEIVRAVKQGEFIGRETYAFGGYYKDE